MTIQGLINKIFKANQTQNNTVSWSGSNGLKSIQEDIVDTIRQRTFFTVPSTVDLTNQGFGNAVLCYVQDNAFFRWQASGTPNGTTIFPANDGGVWVQETIGDTDGTVTSIGITAPAAFTVTGSPVTTSGIIDIAANGTASEYIKGDGTLGTLPTPTGGTVTSVGITNSGNALNITNSPITSSGDINIGFNGTSADYIDGSGDTQTFPAIHNVIPGGTTGQLLAKTSNVDYDLTWLDNYADWTEQLRDTVKATVAINKGQAVYISGANGTNQLVALASNVTEATSSKTLGLAMQNFAINDIGQIITEGLLGGLNTIGANAGDPVWLGTGGNLIYGLVNKPVAPAHLVYIGVVTRVNSSNGEIYVKIQNGFELQELHNVLITSPVNNDGLFYNSSTQLWVNKSIPSALGYTPISLTSLSASLPLSYNNTTGAFSIAQANTTTNGYLSSTDWNTFNSKQNTITLTTTGTSGAATLVGSTLNIPQYQSVLTNPVTGTGTLNYHSKWTSSSTLGNSLIYDDGTNVGIGTTSPSYKLDVAGTGRFQNNLTVFNSIFSGYNSGGSSNDSLKLSSSNLGASFGVQNTNASGFAGIEYIDNSGAVKVFTGFNNSNGQEFRFNNIATGGYIGFLIGSTSAMRIFNTRNIGIGTTTDAGFKLDINGTTRFRNITYYSSSSTIAQIDGGSTLFRVASNDTLYIEPVITVLNNSGSVRIFTPTIYGNQVQSGNCFNWYGNSQGATGIYNMFNMFGTLSTQGGGHIIIQNINPTYSNDSTAQTFKGIYYNPIVTSLLANTTHIAYQNVTGNVLLGTTSGSVGIGANTSINASAILDITSTTKGFLPPRMTNAQRTAIATPAVGLIVYCTDTIEGLYIYKSTGWTFVI